MTAAGAYSIGWATHICEAQRDNVLQKVLNINGLTIRQVIPCD